MQRRLRLMAGRRIAVNGRTAVKGGVIRWGGGSCWRGMMAKQRPPWCMALVACASGSGLLVFGCGIQPLYENSRGHGLSEQVLRGRAVVVPSGRAVGCKGVVALVALGLAALAALVERERPVRATGNGNGEACRPTWPCSCYAHAHALPCHRHAATQDMCKSTP
jgi:hypothetical protein